ncbi:MAG TPA: hypothetical protein VFF32_15850 [Dermatophilaceae bacterium]|jgi:hypothetical protein|nr:hypothetical protein [Dermatophilaceae bacterium]
MGRDEEEPDDREVTTEVSAGIAKWLPVEVSIKRTITNRWSRRGDEFTRRVGEYAGASPEQVEDRFEQEEELADAYITAGEKAVRTSDGDFRDGLARLIAAGLRDDAKVDAVSYYVAVLSQLEPVHLRYLVANIKAEQAITASPGTDGNPTVTFVASVADMPPEIAASAAEGLHAFALLTDRLKGDMVNWSGDPLGAFAVTELGRSLLAYCEASDHPDPE